MSANDMPCVVDDFIDGGRFRPQHDSCNDCQPEKKYCDLEHGIPLHVDAGSSVDSKVAHRPPEEREELHTTVLFISVAQPGPWRASVAGASRRESDDEPTPPRLFVIAVTDRRRAAS